MVWRLAVGTPKKAAEQRVENFEEISGDDVTLYAHWWGAWSISEDPTLTESGKVSAFT